ncbi:MAG: RES family NAD+ phosphorylase [Actinobacteria bacterium]|nr:RES family NAD+ phosphorylase [Actinomycetota bacterium]
MADDLVDFKKKLNEILPIPLITKCYRVLQSEHDPLSVEGSLKYSGRWHLVGVFGALYTGESTDVCLAEIKRQSKMPLKHKYKVTEIDISLSKVLDLTDERSLELLSVKEDQLVSGVATRVASVVLPNSIASSAHALGYEAIIAPSATGKGRIIVIFTNNLTANSYVKKISENILS